MNGSSPRIPQRLPIYACELHPINSESDKVLLSHGFPIVTLKFIQESTDDSSAGKPPPLVPLCEQGLDAVVAEYYSVIASEVRGLRYRPPCNSHEDLMQEGAALLIRAARTFVPQRSHNRQFVGYARVCVRNGLRDIVKWASRDSQRTIRGISAGWILATDNEGNAPLAHAPAYMHDYQPEQVALSDSESTVIRSILNELPARHRAVTQLAYIDDWSLRQISDYVGLSRTRVHQILQESREHVKKRYRELSA